MSLRLVILGVLAEQPLHGYAIQAALEERFGELCDPAFGDVYRVLAALSRDGLVTVSTARIGRRPRRKVYAPSAAGRRALVAWLHDGRDGDARPSPDEPWLRMLIAARAAPDVLPVLLDAEVRRRRGALRELEALRPSPRGAADFTALARALRHAGALEQARVALWTAELCHRVVRRHADGVPVTDLLRALARGGDGIDALVPAGPRRSDATG
jgi:DNA-binding PadR family transcriptional regulator